MINVTVSKIAADQIKQLPKELQMRVMDYIENIYDHIPDDATLLMSTDDDVDLFVHRLIDQRIVFAVDKERQNAVVLTLYSKDAKDMNAALDRMRNQG